MHFHINILNWHSQTSEVELIHILQMKEVGIKEITGLAQGNTANKSKNQDQRFLPQNN